MHNAKVPKRMDSCLFLLWDIVCHPVARLMFFWICLSAMKEGRRPRLHLVERIPAIPFPEPYAHLAHYCARVGPECKTGIALLEKLGAGGQNVNVVRRFLVDLYLWNNQLPLALEHCKKLEEEASFPGFYEYYMMGNILVRLGEYNDAIDYYSKAVDLKPESADAHCALGAGYAASGMKKEAAREYSIAIALEPDGSAADFARKKLLNRKGGD